MSTLLPSLGRRGAFVPLHAAALLALFVACRTPGAQVHVIGAGVDAPDAFCRDFRLTAEQARRFFERAEVLTPERLHDDFQWLPCFVDGETVEGGSKRTWRIRAGGTAEVSGRDGNLAYYGCKSCDDLLR